MTPIARIPVHVILTLSVISLTLLGYSLSLAPDISWGDSPELALAVHSLGIPHPTGYPFYVLAGKAFSLLLPWGSLAVKLNLFSAVCASLALGGWYLVVWYWLRLVGAADGASRHVASVCAALLLASSFTFWSQAIITEVYALASLFFVALTGCALRYWDRGSTPWLRAFVFTSGLALTHHLLVVFVLPGLFWLVFLGPLRSSQRSRPAASVLLWLIPGLAFELYLPLRAAQDPILNWGDPDTLLRFWTHVTGSEFASHRANLLASPGVFIAYLTGWIKSQLVSHFQEFHFLVLFGFLGLWQMLRQWHPSHVPILLAPLLLSFFLQGHFVQDLYVFFVFVYVFTAMWAASGFAWFLALLRRRAGGRVFAAGCAVALLLPVCFIRANLSQIRAMNTHEVDEFGKFIMERLPPNALILTGFEAGEGDNELFPLWYQKYVLGNRADVGIIAAGMLVSHWYDPMLAREGVAPGIAGEVTANKEAWSALVHDRILLPQVDRPLFSMSRLPFPSTIPPVQQRLEAQFPIDYNAQLPAYRRFLPGGRLYTDARLFSLEPSANPAGGER